MLKARDKEYTGVTKFFNYKEIDGLLLPHSIDSNHMGKMEIIVGEVNPVISADTFAMPK
ncbi:MAG: hypothetical protein IPN29_21710 [Saprospiraceae bacterium]|nr:hypothetical protein [Saprospiraceae bacterium]